jgi:hypothetical protein
MGPSALPQSLTGFWRSGLRFTHDEFRVLSRLTGLPKGNVAAFERVPNI